MSILFSITNMWRRFWIQSPAKRRPFCFEKKVASSQGSSVAPPPATSKVGGALRVLSLILKACFNFGALRSLMVDLY